MRAAVLHAPATCGSRSRPDPDRRRGEVIIEVTYNGLCGTDATEYTKGPMMVPLTTPHPGSGHVGPTILGHEFIGTVVDAGPDASALGRRRGRLRRGRLVRCVRLVPAGPHEPVRALLHARAEHPRRAGRVRRRPRPAPCVRFPTAAPTSRPRWPSRSRSACTG